MDCTETLRLLEGSPSYRHQQDRKARRKKKPNCRYESSPKQSVERRCVYQGDNLLAGIVRPSHGLLQEKLPISGYEVLHRVIDKNVLLNGSEILHTKFRIHIVNMNITLSWAEYTPMDDNIWGLVVCHPTTGNVEKVRWWEKDSWKVTKSRYSYAQQCRLKYTRNR